MESNLKEALDKHNIIPNLKKKKKKKTKVGFLYH